VTHFLFGLLSPSGLPTCVCKSKCWYAVSIYISHAVRARRGPYNRAWTEHSLSRLRNVSMSCEWHSDPGSMSYLSSRPIACPSDGVSVCFIYGLWMGDSYIEVDLKVEVRSQCLSHSSCTTKTCFYYAVAYSLPKLLDTTAAALYEVSVCLAYSPCVSRTYHHGRPGTQGWNWMTVMRRLVNALPLREHADLCLFLYVCLVPGRGVSVCTARKIAVNNLLLKQLGTEFDVAWLVYAMHVTLLV
jgi:hypothetical protein